MLVQTESVKPFAVCAHVCCFPGEKTPEGFDFKPPFRWELSAGLRLYLLVLVFSLEKTEHE